MIEFRRIGKSNSCQEIVDDLANCLDTEEIVYLRKYRDEEGKSKFDYSYSGRNSRFEIAGCLMELVLQVLGDEA